MQLDKLKLAEELRKAREDLGLTQEEWAHRLGVSVRTVSRWELGESAPRSRGQKEAIVNSIGEVNKARAESLGKMLSIPSTVAGSAVAGAFGATVGVAAGPAGVGVGSLVGVVATILLQAKMRGHTLDDVIASLGLSQKEDGEDKGKGSK